MLRVSTETICGKPHYNLWIFPVIAGSGARLFDGFDLTHLQLVDASTFESGIVVHVLAQK